MFAHTYHGRLNNATEKTVERELMENGLQVAIEIANQDFWLRYLLENVTAVTGMAADLLIEV